MEYYNCIAGGYQELYKQEQMRKLQSIIDNLDISPEDIIADVGGGPCFLTELLPNKIINIDTSEELLKKSQASMNIKADMEAIPLEENTADVVLCVSAIHHAENVEKALLEMKRIGKNRFAITVLNRSEKNRKIKQLLQKHFQVQSTIKNQHDDIFILKA